MKATCRNASLDRLCKPLPHTAEPKTAPTHLFVVAKLTKEILLLSSIGVLVLEVVLDLLLTALLRPGRPKVRMCQRALFCRGTELNINSPRQHDAPQKSKIWLENKN